MVMISLVRPCREMVSRSWYNGDPSRGKMVKTKRASLHQHWLKWQSLRPLWGRRLNQRCPMKSLSSYSPPGHHPTLRGYVRIYIRLIYYEFWKSIILLFGYKYTESKDLEVFKGTVVDIFILIQTNIHRFSWFKKWTQKTHVLTTPMNGENRPLVTGEVVEFGK